MSQQIEWEGSAPEPDANTSVGKAGDAGEATHRSTRLLNRVAHRIFAEHRKARRIEGVTLPERVVAEQTSPHNVAAPDFIATIAGALKRIADHFDPPPPDVVDSVYVSQKLGCTTTWIADQARTGKIPAACLVPGTGNGKPWKFYREKIEKWIREQR